MNKYTVRRYLLFVASLFINAFGIAFITKALLGTSPITSVTYVLSLFTPFTMGIWTILLNLLFVVLEPFLMTRKDLKDDLRMYLLQIPISFCFGLFIDFSMFMLSWLQPSAYATQVVVLLVGCVILALGIALEVKANAAMMGMSREEHATWTELGETIQQKLEEAVRSGCSPESEEGKQIARLHRQWLTLTGTPYTPAKHRGIAELYVLDERFTAYYDKRLPGCARFLRDAVACWIK